LASRTRTLPRPPQARLANMTTTRSPLKDEPGWTTHTPFPNFGKAEYFCESGLTRGRHRRGPVARMKRSVIREGAGRSASSPRITLALHPGTGASPPYIICLAQKNTRRFPAGCSFMCFDRFYQLR
jgi:hypothetical protein